MRLGILLTCEMHIIGCHNLDAEFLAHIDKHLVDPLLLLVCVSVGVFLECPVALQFEIVVFPEYAFEPQCGSLSPFDVAKPLSAVESRRRDTPNTQ